MIVRYSAILPLLFLCFGFFAHAASMADVTINEIAWMGSLPEAGETAQRAANDEWLELYNKTSSQVSLVGWALKAVDGNPEITLSGAIEPQGYFILSRANQKVGGIAADLVYPYKNNALSNEGEQLKLFDAQGSLIDEVGNVSGAWLAGTNETKHTMERKNPNLTGSDPANWGTSTPVGGTPRSQNSIFSAPPPQPEPQPEPPPSPPQEPNPPSVIETATTTQPVEMPVTTSPYGGSPIGGQTENPPQKENREKPQTPEVKKISEIKEIKKVKITNKNENKNATSSLNDLSAPPSRQVAAIGGVVPRNNIFAYFLAPLLALFSAGTILVLKKRLKK